MAPPFTSWPPKTLTPSRCAWESRPLREAAAPFLCAISTPARAPRKAPAPKIPGGLCPAGRSLCLRLGLAGRLRLGLGRRLRLGLWLRLGFGVADRGDLDQRVELAVAGSVRVAGLVLVLEDDHLVALGVAEHLRRDREVARLPAMQGTAVVGGDEDRLEAHIGVFHGQVLDLEDVTGLDPVLLSSGADHCVHRSRLPDAT